MNGALDSPLEALALNYLTYGFLTAVNNIWAWIAVITAAVSFWRIRALPTDRSTTSLSLDDASLTSTAPPRVAEIAAEEEKPVAAPAKTSSCRVLERQGSTKMKFSLYYKEEAEVEEDLGRDDNGGESGVGAAVKVEAWSGGDWEWEGVVAMRMGDMGWYRWQERRTVLDGRVVRLWEAERRRRHAAAQVVCGGAAW